MEGENDDGFEEGVPTHVDMLGATEEEVASWAIADDERRREARNARRRELYALRRDMAHVLAEMALRQLRLPLGDE